MGLTSTPVEAVPESALTVLGTDDALARVVDLQVSVDGTVWVLNRTEPFFLAFAPDGAGVEAFGHRGDGPGEFRQPLVLLTGAEARDVWVYELTRHALLRIGDPDDWQEVVLPRNDLPSNTLVSLDDVGILGPRPWFARSESSFLVARSKGQPTLDRISGAPISSRWTPTGPFAPPCKFRVILVTKR